MLALPADFRWLILALHKICCFGPALRNVSSDPPVGE
jgi:hypothetical protein